MGRRIMCRWKNRRDGIGRKLINKAIEVAKENNCKRLELNCWEENYKAISFYEKQGMQTQEKNYGNKHIIKEEKYLWSILKINR